MTSIHNHLEFLDSLTSDLNLQLTPLLKTTLFGYRYFDKTGKSFGWSTNNQWNHFFIQHFSNMSLSCYETEVANANQQGKYQVVRTDAPTSNDELSRNLYKFGIWNTIGCYVKGSDCVEGFYFSNIEGGSDWINHYLNQPQLLEKYYTDFKEKLLNITSWDVLHQFSLPTVNSNIFSEPHHDMQKTFLTTREKECLQFISKGYTNKEIARQLSLSPRTIEWYVENIKTKVGVYKRTDLIKTFSHVIEPVIKTFSHVLTKQRLIVPVSHPLLDKFQ